MKKLVSALTVGAIIAGAAFADVSIGLNFRQRANLLSHNFAVGDKKATSKILFTDAYSGNGTDNLAIGLSGDIVSFNATLVADQATTAKIRSKSFNGNVSLGKVQLFGGLWADGKVDGDFRNKTDIDAGNMEGMDFEFKKLGSAFAGSPSFFVDNIVNPVDNKAESYAFGGEWKVPSPKSVKFTLKGTYITNSVSDESSHGKDNQLKGHTFAGLLKAQAEHVTTELVFKYGDLNKADAAKKPLRAMAFGLYAMPVTISGLTTTIGGAGSVVDGTFTDFSADLRLRYKTGNLSITSFHSYSALVDAEKSSKYVSNKTTKGLADRIVVDTVNDYKDNKPANKYFYKYKKDTDTIEGISGAHSGTVLYRDAILTNNIMLRYKINKTFSAYGFVADMIGFGQSKGKDVENIIDGKKVVGEPIVQLRAGLYGQASCGSSSISAGVVYAIHDVTKTESKDSMATLAVPVIFRVKM